MGSGFRYAFFLALVSGVFTTSLEASPPPGFPSGSIVFETDGADDLLHYGVTAENNVAFYRIHIRTSRHAALMQYHFDEKKEVKQHTLHSWEKIAPGALQFSGNAAFAVGTLDSQKDETEPAEQILQVWKQDLPNNYGRLGNLLADGEVVAGISPKTVSFVTYKRSDEGIRWRRIGFNGKELTPRRELRGNSLEMRASESGQKIAVFQYGLAGDKTDVVSIQDSTTGKETLSIDLKILTRQPGGNRPAAQLEFSQEDTHLLVTVPHIRSFEDTGGKVFLIDLKRGAIVLEKNMLEDTRRTTTYLEEASLVPGSNDVLLTFRKVSDGSEYQVSRYHPETKKGESILSTRALIRRVRISADQKYLFAVLGEEGRTLVRMPLAK